MCCVKLLKRKTQGKEVKVCFRLTKSDFFPPSSIMPCAPKASYFIMWKEIEKKIIISTSPPLSACLWAKYNDRADHAVAEGETRVRNWWVCCKCSRPIASVIIGGGLSVSCGGLCRSAKSPSNPLKDMERVNITAKYISATLWKKRDMKLINLSLSLLCGAKLLFLLWLEKEIGLMTWKLKVHGMN